MNQDLNKVESIVEISDETRMKKAQIGEDVFLEPLITTEGSPYQITEEGSLGILAMGYVGIMLWRDKKYSSSGNPETEIKRT